jgi:hypothetical protein
MNETKPEIASPYRIYGAFSLGMVAAVSFRVIIVLMHTRPDWVRPVWYFGVFANLLFFLHRFKISQKRKKAIRENELIEKLQARIRLNDDERDVLVYILSSVRLSPENINYFVIFFFSLLAVAVDLILVFAGR